MTTPLVRFEGVSKRYGDFVAIDRLDLDVAKGEFLTLLGPSGSGKTTTLMMLAGFETPSAGRILLRGAPIAHLPPQKRDFGVVFQSYALFPRMTVADNLAYPLKVRRRSGAEIAARVARALDAAQLTPFADRLPAALSGGQRQRVAVARALVFEPAVVLMDEPLGALDRELRQRMQIEIKHLHGRLGLTVLYVTHDQEEALTMSDRIAVFGAGRVEQVADPQTLYRAPASAFVAGFIGENNLIEGRVAALGPGRAGVDLGGGLAPFAVSIAPTAPIGAPVTLSVRPEALRPWDGAAPNRLEVTLRDAIFTGQQFRLICDLDDGRPIVALLPADTPPPGPGARLVLGCAAEACLSFPFREHTS